MPSRPLPLLHRDDPDKAPLVGHVKVTFEDWLNVARDLLVSEGVSEVKVLAIGDRLKVSRSSFYWYFKNRNELLNALLNDWEARNTAVIVEHCAQPTKTITEAVCNFFRCFVDPGLFDQGLDFAIREWARRDGGVRARIDLADGKRLAAIAAMYERHGFDPDDADARARILYFMQLGYHALDQSEPMQQRMSRMEGYLKGFTGVVPSAQECADFRAYCAGLESPSLPASQK